MEYKTGDQWGPFTAPRANRYILHNDNSNPTINSLEFFDQPLKEFDPRLLVVSGLQMMDSFPYAAGEREQRLQKLRQQIASRTAATLIHFEMASYIELALINQLFTHVIPFSDSIGMNEQELANLRDIVHDGSISFASESNPRVANTLDAIRAVFRKLSTNYYENTVQDERRRRVSRIHVHTLAYQAILVDTSSEWRNTKNAAAKSALTAHRTVCGSTIINPESANLILDDSFATSALPGATTKRIKIETINPVACWSEKLQVNDGNVADVEICVAPVLVCKVARQTAGAGDNISAAGLVLQI